MGEGGDGEERDADELGGGEPEDAASVVLAPDLEQRSQDGVAGYEEEKDLTVVALAGGKI